jgi:osmotically-inducible protein OsmY
MLSRDFPMQKNVLTKVENGTVTLSGTTRTLWAKNNIAKQVKRLYGVQAVINDLKVGASPMTVK